MSFFLIAPRIASIIACKITSPSECPLSPEWNGILTPPKYSFLFLINLKGKTVEKLGLIGKEKAIACEVICSISKWKKLMS